MGHIRCILLINPLLAVGKCEIVPYEFRAVCQTVGVSGVFSKVDVRPPRAFEARSINIVHTAKRRSIDYLETQPFL